MDIILSVLIGYILFAVVVIYVLVLGQSNYHKDGLVGKLHYAMTKGLENCLSGCFQTICPGIARRSFSRFTNYFMYKPNPILQLLYLSLVICGSILFFKDTYQYLNDYYLSSYHKTGSLIAITFTMITFIVASWSNPGYLSKENLDDFINYPYDRLLYIRKSCETCNLEKPSRSKHCRVCDRCVARMDHHCPWINNCVGENNLRYFLLFVFSTSMLCAYGFYLCSGAILTIVETKNIFNLGYSRNGKWEPLPTAVLIKYIFYESQSIFPLGIFCLVISLFLLYFFGYHIWLVLKNKTTNETFKYQDLKEQIGIQKQQDKFEKEIQKKHNNNNNQQKSKRSQKKSSSSSNQSINIDDNNDKIALPLPPTFKQVINPFDKGAYNNLFEVLLPPKPFK